MYIGETGRPRVYCAWADHGNYQLSAEDVEGPNQRSAGWDFFVPMRV